MRDATTTSFGAHSMYLFFVVLQHRQVINITRIDVCEIH